MTEGRNDKIDKLLELVSAEAIEICNELQEYKESNSYLVMARDRLMSENESLRKRVGILEEKLEDYSGFIQDLARYYVPDEDWSEVHKAMEDLGIEYVGPDDV